MNPAIIPLIAGAALELLPVLREITGINSIKEFIELMDDIQEKGEMPTMDEIKALAFPPPESILKRKDQ